MSDEEIFSLSSKRFQATLKQMRETKLQGDEAIIRDLLGRWVSELEPSIARDRAYNIIGLSAENGEIVVRTIPEETFFR